MDQQYNGDVEGPPPPVVSTTTIDVQPQQQMASPRMQRARASPNVQRTQQTFVDGDSTRQVTTETSQQQFGSTTVTKVRREEVSTSGGGWQSPLTQRHEYIQEPSMAPPVFNVPKIGSGPQRKPGVWAPPGADPGYDVTAAEGVHVNYNPDHSVTMTLGMHSPRQMDYNQEPSHAPYKSIPQFNVAKIGTDQPSGIWNPGGAPPPRKSPQPRPVSMPIKSPSPEPELQQHQPDGGYGGAALWQNYQNYDLAARDSPITRVPVNPPQVQPIEFSKLVKGESFSDEDYADSPLMHKSKIFLFEHPLFHCFPFNT